MRWSGFVWKITGVRRRTCSPLTTYTIALPSLERTGFARRSLSVTSAGDANGCAVLLFVTDCVRACEPTDKCVQCVVFGINFCDTRVDSKHKSPAAKKASSWRRRLQQFGRGLELGWLLWLHWSCSCISSGVYSVIVLRFSPFPFATVCDFCFNLECACANAFSENHTSSKQYAYQLRFNYIR